MPKSTASHASTQKVTPFKADNMPTIANYEIARISLVSAVQASLIPSVAQYEATMAHTVAEFYCTYTQYVSVSEIRSVLELRKTGRDAAADFPQLFIADIFRSIELERKKYMTIAALDTARITILNVIRYLEHQVSEKEWMFDGFPSVDEALKYISEQGGVSEIIRSYNMWKKTVARKERVVQERLRAEALAEHEEAELQKNIQDADRRGITTAALLEEKAIKQKQADLAAEEMRFFRHAKALETMPTSGLQDGIFVSYNGITYVMPWKNKLDVLSHGKMLLTTVE